MGVSGKPELHADLSFIPEDQLIYHKLDLSEYRGVMWSRWKTSQVDVEYDYLAGTDHISCVLDKEMKG